MPVFEAVVNSIQAIEDDSKETGNPLDSYYVKVEILREGQDYLPVEGVTSKLKCIEAFRITDNGIGFDDDNWASFQTLDTLHKVEKGCRGIGRLLWLKAFKSVRVVSDHRDGGENRRRKFTFDDANDVTPLSNDVCEFDHRETAVDLIGFNPRYANSVHKSLESIAQGLLEHCLWYFVRKEGVPQITVYDGDEDPINLFDLYDSHMHSEAFAETITIKDVEFEITHAKFRASQKKLHTLCYCAAGRLVKEEPIVGKISGLASELLDQGGAFTYSAYLTSPFLDSKVVEERTGFNIENEVDGLFAETEISYKDIKNAVFERIEAFLSGSLDRNMTDAKERVDDFVNKKAPRYRPLMRYIPADDVVFSDPKLSDKELDQALHKHVFRVEQELIETGHDVLTPRAQETEDDYASRVEQYLQTASDLKKSDLANYVAHRRVVIDLLEAAIKQQDDGKFVREDLIHEMIVPMRATSNDIKFRRQSLWLLDERLAFHDYLASDKSLNSMPITENEEGKEPDIAALKVFENPLLVSDTSSAPQASLTVVEIKRPMRKDVAPGQDDEKDPIFQALNYLRKLREGTKTVSGRPIPNASKIPGFIYVLADFTPHMIECCEFHQLKITADGQGYFGHHSDKNYNAYIQVFSFDGLVSSAKERNRAFFDKLGFPSN